jgi:hypothetical protein
MALPKICPDDKLTVGILPELIIDLPLLFRE